MMIVIIIIATSSHNNSAYYWPQTQTRKLHQRLHSSPTLEPIFCPLKSCWGARAFELALKFHHETFRLSQKWLIRRLESLVAACLFECNVLASRLRLTVERAKMATFSQLPSPILNLTSWTTDKQIACGPKRVFALIDSVKLSARVHLAGKIINLAWPQIAMGLKLGAWGLMQVRSAAATINDLALSKHSISGRLEKKFNYSASSLLAIKRLN